MRRRVSVGSCVRVTSTAYLIRVRLGGKAGAKAEAEAGAEAGAGAGAEGCGLELLGHAAQLPLERMLPQEQRVVVQLQPADAQLQHVAGGLGA